LEEIRALPTGEDYYRQAISGILLAESKEKKPLDVFLSG